jgi:hypothetical protein
MVEHPAGEANQVAGNAVAVWIGSGVNGGTVRSDIAVKEIVVGWLLNETNNPFLWNARLCDFLVIEHDKPIVGIVIHELNAIRLLPNRLLHNPSVQGC